MVSPSPFYTGPAPLEVCPQCCHPGITTFESLGRDQSVEGWVVGLTPETYQQHHRAQAVWELRKWRCDSCAFIYYSYQFSHDGRLNSMMHLNPLPRLQSLRFPVQTQFGTLQATVDGHSGDKSEPLRRQFQDLLFVGTSNGGRYVQGYALQHSLTNHGHDTDWESRDGAAPQVHGLPHDSGAPRPPQASYQSASPVPSGTSVSFSAAGKMPISRQASDSLQGGSSKSNRGPSSGFDIDNFKHGRDFGVCKKHKQSKKKCECPDEDRVRWSVQPP